MPRDRFQVFLRQRDHLLRLHVAHRDHHAVVRRVAHAEVGLEILHGPGLDVGRPAHHWPMVRVRNKRRGLQQLVQRSERTVLAIPPFRVDDAALRFDHLRFEAQVANAVGFHIHHLFQQWAWKPVGVDGLVFAGRGVVVPAVLLHHDVELLRAVFLGAVKHHVLEEVGHSGGPHVFVPRANLEKEIERDLRDVVILLDQQFHPVVERVGLHRELLAAGQCGEQKKYPRGESHD